jgi:curved DNA-binding protein CbpA
MARALLVSATMDGFRNHYRTLKVEPTADEATIKAAFRRLALRYHPDRASTTRAARRFQDIREAYEVLSDPEKRREYDRVYRAQTALRTATASRAARRRARPGASAVGFGITLDVLGLKVGVAVDAAATPRPPRSPRSQRKKR